MRDGARNNDHDEGTQVRALAFIHGVFWRLLASASHRQDREELRVAATISRLDRDSTNLCTLHLRDVNGAMHNAAASAERRKARLPWSIRQKLKKSSIE